MYATSYRRLDRWLHWLALQPTAVREIAFELERLYALPHLRQGAASGNTLAGPADGAVYVCGLARSGTTMLLRLLDQLSVFRSLNYRDMPFVLAPNLWRWLSRHSQRQTQLAERPHGDGVLVDFDSPESFEEVFWRTFSTTAQPQPDHYGSEAVSADALAAFADYRALVANPKTQALAPGDTPKRYLSKNNNNLLRLRSLAADPTATVLLVYRDPIATSRSLHHLHQRFSAHTAAGFTQQYMHWLGHHEFGHGHLPFCFAKPHMNPAFHPSSPDYWLDYWNAVYLHILQLPPVRVNLVNYDLLCQKPHELLDTIFNLLATPADVPAMATQVRRQAAPAKAPTEFSPALVESAMATHARLVASQANVYQTRASIPNGLI